MIGHVIKFLCDTRNITEIEARILFDTTMFEISWNIVDTDDIIEENFGVKSKIIYDLIDKQD